MVDLLPCPFCGSAKLQSGGDDKFVGVRCLTCEATGPNHYRTGSDWGIRTTTARIAALEGALKPFAELNNEGSEDFDDDEPVVVSFGRTSDFTIKLGDIRLAAAALAPTEAIYGE